MLVRSVKGVIMNKAVKISIGALAGVAVIAAVLFAVFSAPVAVSVADKGKNHEVTEFSLKEGKYYFKGDVSTDFYIEVLPDKQICSGGSGQLKYPTADFEQLAAQGEVEVDDAAQSVQNIIDDYGKPSKYFMFYFADMDYTGIIINGSINESGDGATGYGYKYIDENTIYWISTGDFIYKE